MKQALSAAILLLVIAAMTSGLYGCDEKKDNDTSLLLGVLAGGNKTWNVITPSSGDRHVPVDTNFVFQHDGNLNPAVDGLNDYIAVSYSDGGTMYYYNNAGSAVITIAGDTVTVNPDTDASHGRHCTAITIYGFRDEGVAATSTDVFTTGFYSFTTE
jgi:hypothetical protein